MCTCFYSACVHVALAERILAVREAGKEMVAYPVDRYAAFHRRDSDFRFQLRHRLGALSVLLNDARSAAYPWHLRLLP